MFGVHSKFDRTGSQPPSCRGALPRVSLCVIGALILTLPSTTGRATVHDARGNKATAEPDNQFSSREYYTNEDYRKDYGGVSFDTALQYFSSEKKIEFDSLYPVYNDPDGRVNCLHTYR
ncbi:hypothetical protein KRP22_014453 [Phytophthora ramorum]|nr:hypothetical protein KRP22_8943 [Phytophthora ramorum]